MANNNISMPSSGGLTRFSEEVPSKFQFPPIGVIIMIIVVVIVEFYFYKFG